MGSAKHTLRMSSRTCAPAAANARAIASDDTRAGYLVHPGREHGGSMIVGAWIGITREEIRTQVSFVVTSASLASGSGRTCLHSGQAVARCETRN